MMGANFFTESWAPETPVVVTLSGGGNATHVLAGLLGSKNNVTVHLLCLLKDECARLQEAHARTGGKFTLEHEDGKATQVGKVAKITSDPAEVIPHTDLFLVTVPAFAHQAYFEAAAPHLRPGACVGVMVAQGGVDFCAKYSFGTKMRQVTFFAFQTLPWACRYSKFGEAALIKGLKTGLDMVVSPPAHGEQCRAMCTNLMGLPMRDSITGHETTELYPELQLLPNFLSPTLMNPNAIVHPSIVYGAFHDWNGVPFAEMPLFYEGLDESGAEQMSGVCDEILLIKDAVHQRDPNYKLDMVMHMRQFVLYSYGDDVVNQTSLKTSFNTNKGYKGLTHPCVQTAGGYAPDFGHRYMTEDVPAGLVVIKGIALLAGVDTPTIDRQLYWCQEKMNKEYLVYGQLTGKDMHETRAPQRYNITSFDEVLN